MLTMILFSIKYSMMKCLFYLLMYIRISLSDDWGKKGVIYENFELIFQDFTHF